MTLSIAQLHFCKRQKLYPDLKVNRLIIKQGKMLSVTKLHNHVRQFSLKMLENIRKILCTTTKKIITEIPTRTKLKKTRIQITY